MLLVAEDHRILICSMAHPSCYFNVFAAGAPPGPVHLVGMSTIWDRDRNNTVIGTIYRMQSHGYLPGEGPSPWIRHLRKRFGKGRRCPTFDLDRSPSIRDLHALHEAVVDRWGPGTHLKGEWTADDRYRLTLIRRGR